MIKKSLIFKTNFVILIVLVIISAIIGYYSYVSQNQLIQKLIDDNKKTVIQNLEKEEKSEILKETANINNIAISLKDTIANDLYNLDTEAMVTALKELLKNQNIKGVSVFDSGIKEIFITIYKKNNTIAYDKKPLKLDKKYKSLTFDLEVEGEKLGYFTIYYDLSIVIEKIKNKKAKEIEKFNKKIKQLNREIREKIYQQMLIFALSNIFVALLIAYLLKVHVSKPLMEFKRGLDSFFDFLINPDKKVEKIAIDREDEFGQMSKSVNKSIEVGIQIHSQMAQLMNAVDKYVITTETDENGIITYASEAFCNISGYTKEELIGKPHSIVKHPDMPQEVFKDLWETTKSGKVWRGEIKNKKKDGGYYWLDTIISQKCDSNGICGYTAIRYDITDKKRVEELTKNLEIKVQERTKELEESKKQIEAIHKHTKESIEFASLIQGAVVAQSSQLRSYFKDSFVTWQPKDIVGGDIWLFSNLRHQDECLLMVIDCTGHGVPGAFVTMIVKAIEREISGIIKDNPKLDVSPAWILSYFNKTMKVLLKQENENSLSNAGFDGGIIYYNRREQVIKFAGAETPLFYITKDGELKTIKGDRYSVGYKKCDANYQYKEHIIQVEEGMKFFITTDGYLDQNGGPKGYPFGKKRFSNILKQHYKESMADIQTILQYEMMEWEMAQPNNERNDDMTVIGFEIGPKSDYKEDAKEEIFKYEGVITQNVIATAMDNIENKITNINLVGTISTITIEYCQNMLKYSKDNQIGTRDIVPEGEIEIQLINNEYYEITAKNIISIEDKDIIEPRLKEIISLDKKDIKKRYRELRKSGKNTHEKGGGIGLYEIAKISDEIKYKFDNINGDKLYFTMSSIVNIKGK